MAVLLILTSWPRLPPNRHPRWNRPRLGSQISVAKLPWLNWCKSAFFDLLRLDQNLIIAPTLQFFSTQKCRAPTTKTNKQEKISKFPPPRCGRTFFRDVCRGRTCAARRRRRPNGRRQQTQPQKKQTAARPPYTETQGRDKHARTKHKGTKIARRNFLERAFRCHEAGQPRPPTMSLRKKSPPRPLIFFSFFFILLKIKEKREKNRARTGDPSTRWVLVSSSTQHDFFAPRFHSVYRGNGVLVPGPFPGCRAALLSCRASVR